ncbi:MAG: hypothetical protein M0R66_00495 [Candidatus Omnitrophica bacterium]|nr:hypothetical protein [Candidatus Omnitrophota bacterium]
MRDVLAYEVLQSHLVARHYNERYRFEGVRCAQRTVRDRATETVNALDVIARAGGGCEGAIKRAHGENSAAELARAAEYFHNSAVRMVLCRRIAWRALVNAAKRTARYFIADGICARRDGVSDARCVAAIRWLRCYPSLGENCLSGDMLLRIHRNVYGTARATFERVARGKK